MAYLAIFRSMQNVRSGEQHRPLRAIDLDEQAVAFLRACDVEPGTAWATDRLTEVRRRLESEAKLLRAYVTDAECRALGRTSVDDEVRPRIAARLASDVRFVAVQRFVELAREAEMQAMTLVLSHG